MLKLASQSSTCKQEVVIVGAGPGGLANAMLLAKSGANVRILERADRVGGRTSTVGAGGFKFDLGPTFFLYPEVLRSIFRMSGLRLEDYVELIELDPHYRLVYEGGEEVEISRDPDKLRREIAKLSPADAGNLEHFMSDNRRKLAAFKPILESSFESARDLLDYSLMEMLPLMRPWHSVDSDLGRYFKDPRVRLAFSFQSKYLGMSPFRCPSLFTILSFLEYEHGIYHPRGGCGAVSRAMAKAATELGVEIHLEEPVQEVLFEGRRAVGVRTDKQSYRSDALVINADFAQAMTKLVPNRLRSRWTDAKIEKKRFSCSTFMMYLGVEGRFPDLAHHTIYLAEDYRQNLADIETRHMLSDSPSFYVHNPCATDSAMAPPGMSSLYVLVPVTHQHPNVDWETQQRRFRELTLRQLGRIGLDDLESRIRYEKIVTPADWQDHHQIYKGATFNLAHNLGQMLHLRPNNRFEDLDSVYLVGGGTHPGSGLPVIYESAKISSRLLAQDLGLETSWQDVEPPRESIPTAAAARQVAQIA